MPCKPYKDALMEAAAGGAVQGELRAHLATCAECHAAFEQERALYAAVDASVFAAANAEVPASLLPQVRARLDKVPVRGSMWATNWLVWASAAAVLVALLAARVVWRPPVVEQPVQSAANPLVPPVTAPPQNHSPNGESPVKKSSGSDLQIAKAARHSPAQAPVKQDSLPEVLVPHDQEILLADYADQWAVRKHSIVLAQGFESTVLSPLQMAPIQIDELDVKPLAEGNSQ